MKAKIANKARCLFWLGRKIKALETAAFDHEGAAYRGQGYTARIATEADLAKLREVARFVQANAE